MILPSQVHTIVPATVGWFIGKPGTPQWCPVIAWAIFTEGAPIPITAQGPRSDGPTSFSHDGWLWPLRVASGDVE